jgi:thioredoxin 1
MTRMRGKGRLDVSDLVTPVTDAEFEQTVVGSAVPFVLDFWAPWCAPCRMMEPVISELAVEHEGKIAFGKLNVDDNPATAMKFDVLSIPTLLVFSGGAVVKRLVGANPKKKIEQELQEWIG